MPVKYPVASCSTEWPDVGYELKSAINAFDRKIININKDLWHLAVADIYVLNENKSNIGCSWKLVGIWCWSRDSPTIFLSYQEENCILNDVILGLLT